MTTCGRQEHQQQGSEGPQPKASGETTGPRKTRWGRAVTQRAASVLLGLLAGLLLAEMAVRVAGIEPERPITKRRLVDESNPSVVYHCYPSNPHGEFQPLPDLGQGDWRLSMYTFERTPVPLAKIDQTPWCVKYEYSSKVIRDREYDIAPPENVVRIAGIGDSFAFGEGVPLERTLFRQMETILGDGYEIVNAGQVGANTADELSVLSNVVVGAHCTRAVFVFIPNDVGLTPRLDGRQRYINDLIVIRDRYQADYEERAWYTGHFRIIHLIGSHLAMRRVKLETIQWYLDCYDPRFNQNHLQQLERDIASLGFVPGCRVAFVLFPLMDGFDSEYPLKPIHERVARMARKAGLPVLDLTQTFAGQKTSTLWVHPSDHHPNGKAHRIAARAIVDWLERDVPGFLEKGEQ